MVSVIIPSYNSEGTIYNCLTALREQTYKSDYEIILVDSSIDTTPSIVKKQFPQIQYFHFDKKTDPGTARNFGVKHAKGELILFIDSDCKAEKDWMAKHVQLHQNHSDTAGIGGSVVNGNLPDDIVGWSSYFGEFREFLPQNPSNFTFHIPTLNISYKKWVFEKYGYFDPHYYPQEDLVFNYYLTQKGEKIFFDPSIKVWHTHRSSLKPFLKHQFNIGSKTSQVLKIIPLPGHRIVKNKLLFVFVGPGIPVVKFLRTVPVILKYRSIQFMQKYFSVVILKMGLIFWFFGFFQGVFAKDMGSKK